MIRANAEETIAASADDIWTIAADIARHPRWMSVSTSETLQGTAAR